MNDEWFLSALESSMHSQPNSIVNPKPFFEFHDFVDQRLSIYSSTHLTEQNKINKIKLLSTYSLLYVITDLFLTFNTFIDGKGNFKYSRIVHNIPDQINDDNTFVKGSEHFNSFQCKDRTNYIMNNKKFSILSISEKHENLLVALKKI